MNKKNDSLYVPEKSESLYVPEMHDSDCEDKDEEPDLESEKNFHISEENLDNISKTLPLNEFFSSKESLHDSSLTKQCMLKNLSSENVCEDNSKKASGSNIYKSDNKNIVRVDAFVQVKSGGLMLSY